MGTKLEALAERFIDAVYNVDPGLRQTLRESIVRNCRQDKHCEVRRGQRRIFVQHQRLADGGIVSLHSDVTELDEAQRARHQLHDDFLLTAESIHIGIWDWQVSGDTLQSTIPCLPCWASRAHSGDIRCVFSSIRSTRTIAQRYARRCTLRSRIIVRSLNVKFACITLPKDCAGCCCPAVVTLSIEGNAERVIGTLQDITRRKEAEIQAFASAIEAQKPMRRKARSPANMSHEIRTPMNGIIGMTQLCPDTSLSADQRDYLNLVMSSAQSLLHIINDILDFSRIEAGKVELESEPVPVRPFIQSLIRPHMPGRAKRHRAAG